MTGMGWYVQYIAFNYSYNSVEMLKLRCTYKILSCIYKTLSHIYEIVNCIYEIVSCIYEILSQI